MAQQCPKRHAAASHAGYLPIEDYGMIGNMHTCALVGMNGSVDYMCWYETYFTLESCCLAFTYTNWPMSVATLNIT